MKRIISLILAVACTMACVLTFNACGEKNSVPVYYGKTLSFTGNALPILWDKKCKVDDGPDNYWDESKNGFHDSKEYSYTELLNKYWDRVDFDHESPEGGKPWESMKGKTVKEFKSEIDKGLKGFYDSYMGLSSALKFEFGSKSDRTLKISVLGDEGIKAYNTKFVETDAQYAEEENKIDPKASYCRDVALVRNEGRSCVAFIDEDDNGLYDGYVFLMLTAYVVNGGKPSVILRMCRKSGVNEDESYYSDIFSFDDIPNHIALWGQETSVLTLPLYPEITLA